MRKLLRSFLGWLDRRFPEKVTVTQADYLTLKAQIETAGKLLVQYDEHAKKQSTRIEALETAVKNMSVQMGLGDLQKRVASGAAFVR